MKMGLSCKKMLHIRFLSPIISIYCTIHHFFNPNNLLLHCDTSFLLSCQLVVSCPSFSPPKYNLKFHLYIRFNSNQGRSLARIQFGYSLGTGTHFLQSNTILLHCGTCLDIKGFFLQLTKSLR